MLESNLENNASDQIDYQANSESVAVDTVDTTDNLIADTDNVAVAVADPSTADKDLSVENKIEKKKKKSTEKESKKDQSKKKNKAEVKEKAADKIEKTAESEIPKGKDWYILKVQVNREDIIKKNLLKRAKITGLEQFFGDILVPTEKITEIRNEKKRVVKRVVQRKLYPGYIMINMEINDDTWFLVRETPGIGDFTGAIGKPTPMLPHEVQRMLAAEKEDPAESPKLKVGYSIGDQIKIKEGSFESLNGVVDAIDYASGRVVVIVNMFGRSTPVDLEYWQIEQNSG
ncbi:MAG: transcription termination/antitermination protein NusG [Planctomycetaceae bacterium]|jgi:transcriptional antiterminator NusG|nr:transcription termination/antitermination protein NusG [Planctomycetaceae bacterium]